MSQAISIPQEKQCVFKRILIALMSQWHLKRLKQNSESKAKWRRENPEIAKKVANEHRVKNPEKYKVYARTKYLKRRELSIAYSRLYRKNHPESTRIACERWRKNNLEKITIAARLRSRKSYLKNKTSVLVRNLERQRERTKSDPIYALIRGFRTRLWKLVKRKSQSTWSLVGCDAKKLRTHIQSLFKPGMNWENHGSGNGKWVVDHKNPVSSFDHSNQDELKKCWHFSNLQPLWWNENLMKSDKILSV